MSSYCTYIERGALKAVVGSPKVEVEVPRVVEAVLRTTPIVGI
jgi:hypothetical protein